MTEPHVIYNCETCMFLTRNKKDYTRHLKSRKHLENHPCQATGATDATDATPLHCAKCNKEIKSRNAMYTHSIKSAEAATAAADAADAATAAADAADAAAAEELTPEQIQYIIMENKILKELLKNAIQGHHPAASPEPPNHSV